MARNQFSGPATFFRDRRLPIKATPAGYSALIDYFDLRVPLPRTLFAIGDRHRTIQDQGWHILTPRHTPSPDIQSHLKFAIKYEGLDLAVLKRLFQATGPKPIEAMVKASPTGSYARRCWFLYEWLLSEELNLPDARTGRYVSVVDPNMQFALQGKGSPRHRVRNNLPGTRAFCPMVFCTQVLQEFMGLKLKQKTLEIIDDVPRDILARSSAFLLLKDSKASYAIEGEGPSHDRVQRWARAIGEAGQNDLDQDELVRLQKIVIGDSRFVDLGLRPGGGFVGEHDRNTGEPIPVHISAKADDLPELVQGLIEFEHSSGLELDPVVAAAVLAFGFVYIHPFEDGNGRLHRYLIHHVLSSRGFNPPGLVFPVSAVILEKIEEYRNVLEDYSARLMPAIEWKPTDKGNVQVLNDTADFYRYFDATPHAEFLYDCVRRTIERDLPEEALFLRRYDQFKARVQSLVDMPENTLNLLFRFLRQNQGKLSKRARSKEFSALTDEEVQSIESIYWENTENASPTPKRRAQDR